MTNEELVICIKAGNDVAENMLTLYEQVKAFIHAVAWRYRAYIEIEDLEQEGYLALYDAIDGYNPDLGNKFLTYAEKWIRQAMQRYIQNNACCLRLPVHFQEQIRKYGKAVEGLRKACGREPSESELIQYTGFTPAQIEKIKRLAGMAWLCSLDAPIGGTEAEEIMLSKAVAAPGSLEEETVEKVQAEQLKTVLWACVDTLPGYQPEILKRRFRDGMTLEAVGNYYGVTGDAIRQQEAKALRKLRKPQYSKQLRPFLKEEDRIYSMGITGNGVGSFNRTWTSSTERAALRMMENKGAEETAADYRDRARREYEKMLEKIKGELGN